LLQWVRDDDLENKTCCSEPTTLAAVVQHSVVEDRGRRRRRSTRASVTDLVEVKRSNPRRRRH